MCPEGIQAVWFRNGIGVKDPRPRVGVQSSVFIGERPIESLRNVLGAGRADSVGRGSNATNEPSNFSV